MWFRMSIVPSVHSFELTPLPPLSATTECETVTQLALWIVIGFIPKANIGAWTHHHQHVFTFRYEWTNRILESSHFFHSAITSHLWWLHHVLGHHENYLDQSKDESRWMRPDGTTMEEWEYTFNVTLTSYSRAIGVGKKFPRYMLTFWFMLAINLALLGLLFWFNPLNALMVYLIPMAYHFYKIKNRKTQGTRSPHRASEPDGHLLNTHHDVSESAHQLPRSLSHD